MAGKYGVDEVLKVLVTVVEAGNVVDKLLNGGSVVAIFSLTDEFAALATLDGAVFKAQVQELDADDRGKLVAALKAKLVLSDAKVEALIEEGVDLALDVVATLQKVLAFKAKVVA